MHLLEKTVRERAYKAVKSGRFFIIPEAKGLKKIILNLCLWIIRKL
jgi:hypothetical protein